VTNQQKIMNWQV